ncbi:MAG: hypothetical protein QOI80_1533, partial [Solirubrobacteraceae bacterium]|nr:hypothetical protein [Solirubrobacteraceae bacterium]
FSDREGDAEDAFLVDAISLTEGTGTATAGDC